MVSRIIDRTAGPIRIFRYSTGLLVFYLASNLIANASCQNHDPVTADELHNGVQRMEAYIEQLENDRLETKQASQESESESTDTGEEKDQEEKKPEWYEKIKLRGYTQFRYNYLTHREAGSAPSNHAGDSSIGPDQEFLIRRARLVLSGDVSDHLSVYFQPDFASTPDGSVSKLLFVQVRDWYGDIHLDREKVHRLRVGQSKIPYGWENLQSSANRLYLDRNDAFETGTKDGRDVGVFYYLTPPWAQETFKFISDEGLKGSGNYGVFGLGVYNGQGGSLREFNDELHMVSRLTLPVTNRNGQIFEFGIQAFTGRYVVLGAPISPLGVGPAATPLGTRRLAFGEEGLLDQRLGWSFIQYPQPFGFQAEYTIGRGPELNAAQTLVERGSLHGGYLMANYRYITPCHGEFWPFIRYQIYEGGYKTAPNAPSSSIREWNMGVEWQIKKELELVCEYLITDRTNLQARSSGPSYNQFDGHVLRFQLQINY